MESNSLADDMTKGMGVLDDPAEPAFRESRGAGKRRDPFPHHDNPSKRYFAGFAIPDDEADNFADSVEEGRAVVIYADAGSDAQTIAAGFKAAGLRNVRVY